jgi:TRAP-type transport system periplasmic protein
MPTLTRRAVVSGLAGLPTALAAPHVARAAVRVARFGHNNADSSQFGQGAAAFAQAVEADPVIGGMLRIRVYGNAQLGDDVIMLKSCINGTLDGMLCGTSITANFVPDIGIVNAPYLFASAERARAVLDGPMGAEFMQLSRAQRLPVLAFGENGLRHITSNKLVRTPEDLRGLKIRVPQSAVMLNGFLALGADAAPLAFNLVRNALISGEFQAQENAISLVETAKLYEVQKFLCLTGHIYDAISFIASEDLLEDLTHPQRDALAAAARRGAAVSRTTCDAAALDGIGRLKAAGMTVVDNVDVAAFRAASRPYLEGLSTAFDADRVRRLLAAGASA